MKLTIMMLVAFLAALCAPLTLLAQTDAGSDSAAPAAAASSHDAGAAAKAEPVAAAPEIDPVAQGGEIFRRIRKGEWLPALAAVLILFVYLVRRFGSKLSGWFETKTGGYVTAFGSSLALTVALAIQAGHPLGVDVLATALGLAWAAGGGLEGFSDVVKWFRK